MDLTVPDYVILIAVVAAAIYGAIKGFVAQIVSILSLILGVWCACKFSEYIAKYVKEWFTVGDSVIYIISFVIILIVVILIGHFIGKGIEGVVKLSMLGWLNRLLGFIFAAIKTMIILAVIAYVINYINGMWHIIPQAKLNASPLYCNLIKFYKWLFPYLENFFASV